MPRGEAPGLGAEIVKVIRRAEDGNAEALAKVRELAKKELPYLWDCYGNMAKIAADTLIRASAGENALGREATDRKLAEIRKDLGRPNATPLEKLLAERVALCWLHAYYADAMAAQNLAQSCNARTAEFLMKRQDRAHRQFLAAVKTLAVVKRLAVPEMRAAVAKATGQRGEYLELEETVQAAGAAP
jgi:hypothetical protein